MKKPTLTIILPTYNESENIVPLIRIILSVTNKNNIQAEVIIVDDNSPDGTFAKIVRSFKRNKQVKVFVRTDEKGLASAILYGIKNARHELILVMDTDFNHNPKEIPLMLAHIKKNKLIIGSRFVKNGGMENKLRQWLSLLFNTYLTFLLGHGVNDNLSGFFLMRRKDLMIMPLDDIFNGFGEYFMRLVFTAYQKNYRIVEIPVFYKNRIHGQSKSRFLQMFITYSLCSLHLRFKH